VKKQARDRRQDKEGFASIYACLYKQAFLLSIFGA
jgi:hypothetical protein